MSDYQWTDVRMRAVELFRDAPRAAIEQRVLDVFLEHPALVIEAIEHVGRRFESGQVRSPWVILAKHVEESVRPLEDVHATDERDREKRIARAEQWLRAAGKHYEQAEADDELFGERGLLREWRSDEALRRRLGSLHREVRPEGLLIEQQAEERAERWKATVGAHRLAEIDRKRSAPAEREDPDPEPVLDLDPEPVLA